MPRTPAEEFLMEEGGPCRQRGGRGLCAREGVREAFAKESAVSGLPSFCPAFTQLLLVCFESALSACQSALMSHPHLLISLSRSLRQRSGAMKTMRNYDERQHGVDATIN